MQIFSIGSVSRLTLLIALALGMSVSVACTSAWSATGADTGQSALSISPLRFNPAETDPGGAALQYRIKATNQTSAPIVIRTLPVLLRGSSDPTRLVQAVRANDSTGPTSWVSFPYDRTSWPTLGVGSSLEIPVTVRVPASAAPGTYAIALAVAQVVSAGGVDTGEGSNETAVRLNAGVASEIIINVTGDAISDAKLRSFDAPRLVTSGDRPVFEARVKNTGNTLLQFDAQTALSPFWGAAGRVLRADAQDALPEGERVLRMRWNDPPLVGWFRPELTIVGGNGSGVRITQELPIVWVVPPWWVVLLLVIAIVVPVRTTVRRRRSRAGRAQRAGRARSRAEQRIRIAEAKQRAEQARRRRR